MRVTSAFVNPGEKCAGDPGMQCTTTTGKAGGRGGRRKREGPRSGQELMNTTGSLSYLIPVIYAA